jgi:hypothetical protein
LIPVRDHHQPLGQVFKHHDIADRFDLVPNRLVRLPEADAPRRWADYSYARGGKDGTPFPIDRDTYDRNIAILTDAVRRARVGENDKFHALKRLAKAERLGE